MRNGFGMLDIVSLHTTILNWEPIVLQDGPLLEHYIVFIIHTLWFQSFIDYVFRFISVLH